MVSQMESDERALFYEEAKSDDGFDQMIDDEKENEGFDQESSEDLEKMSEKASSSVKLREGKPKNKAKEAGPGSSVRVCDFCGRVFSSGKALGGHRRFHLQALRKMEAQEKVNHHSQSSNYNTLKINPNSEEFDDDIKSNGNPSSRSFRCCVCGKDFPSQKSLFGHMRSHPEREWRGMNPPFNDNALVVSSPVERKVEEDHGSSSSAFEEEVVVDLSLSCSVSWLKKDKRGRRSIGAAEAALNLLFLSCYGNNLRLPPQEPPATVIPVKKRKKDMNDIGSSSGKQSLKKEEDQVRMQAEINGSDDEIWEMKVMSLKKEEKKKKMLKKKNKAGQEMKLSEQHQLDEKEEDVLIRTLKEAVKSRGYRCSNCNKSFTSFQALGGHRSKHNRGKNIIISTKGKEVVEPKRQEEEEEEEQQQHKVRINGTLSINTSASTGGDGCMMMGCNSKGLSTEEEEEEEAYVNSEERLLACSNDQENNSNHKEELGEASQSGSLKMLGFDLNEPYVMEEGATEKSSFCESLDLPNFRP